jgi:hypothetical protein|tara:strand:+ start:3827 stop:5047 length:1221 start_codon:yes stop_codon:yes gene_type:complete
MSTEVKQEGDFKIKKRTPKKLVGKEDIIKVDLSKPAVELKKEEDAIQKQSADEVPVRNESETSEGIREGNEQPTDEKSTRQDNSNASEAEVDSPIQVIEDEEDNSEEAGVDRSNEASSTVSEQKEVLSETKAQKLPEGVEKLIKFMEETGGTVEDYARLNADYSNVDNNTLLREYYKTSKPHLDSEDVNLLLEDFTWDEEVDEDRDIRKKKIAYKEEVAKAKNFLEQTKSKYYEEIKLRPGVTQEQQKATDFFNRYTEEQKRNETVREGFINTTKDYFSNDFKGFDFKLGDKKVRYGIKDPESTADNQKDLTDFVGTFLGKDGQMKDPAGYHKAIYAARNADTMATHFYEQGRADAIKDQVAKTKNITTEPRQTAPGDVFVNGLKVKAISGLDSSKLKIKTKKFNN